MKKGPDIKKTPLQVPLMLAFREAHAARDAAKAQVEYRDGERVLSERGALRRRGASEAQLKRNLEIDLAALMNTINLGSCVDLSGQPRVARSVLNYGMRDLGHLTSQELAGHDVVSSLRTALTDHEPRLVPDSLEVAMQPEFDDVEQKVAFDVFAEMICRPVDIPLEFVAEIDASSGKVRLSNFSGAE